MTAFMSVLSNDELVSIIFLSIFSIILTALYMIHKSADVALTEAIIGAGLNTAIFMSAISQIKRRNS
ncbi:MAG: Na(+)/H(+) antiporter subunit B [Bacillota bacterium]